MDDIVTRGVDGRPTSLAAMRCGAAVLGGEAAEGGGVARAGAVCFVGTLPLMEAVGWAGKPAALVGLDLLCRSPARRLVLDFDAAKVWVE